jgi:AAA+ superfamily predicted ATPase
MDFFNDSNEHLLAELERIDLLIRIEIAKIRKNHSEDEQFRGLYISEEELDRLLEQPTGQPWWHFTDLPDDQLRSKTSKLKASLEIKKQKTLLNKIPLRLDSLQKLFKLNSNEVDILLICLAIELDLRYERLFAYLQDDVTKKRPSVDLVLNLLQSTGTTKLQNLANFNSDSSLIKNRLLQIHYDPNYPYQPLLAKSLKLDNRITQFLLGSNLVDENIGSFSSIQESFQTANQEYLLDELLVKRLQDIILKSQSQTKEILNIIGTNSTGKLELANTACREISKKLLVVETSQMISDKNLLNDNTIQSIYREALLQDAIVLWKNFELLFDQEIKNTLSTFTFHLGQVQGVTLLDTNTTWQPLNLPVDTDYFEIKAPLPNYLGRIKLWSLALDTDHATYTDLDVTSLASKFKFTGDQILQAVSTAKNLSGWENTDDSQISMKHLYEACRIHSNQKLSTLARKIIPKYQWNDIILPAERTDQLREICNHVKYRDRVYSEWGFGRKLAMGKGLCVLFVGPSGTGKTMASDIIAGELGLDLYKIDLSSVVSKYIGETEKNLSKIFSEAETSNAILFFDEADALFGKRSEVKDSHDRYANIETGYLLQRMEEYEGVVILASNFRKNMDEAFVRRLHFTVEFPLPNEEDRYRIWQTIWPDATPRDADLDLRYLANRFQMTGGNIRNIALSAAFLAADDDGKVNMQHLIRATQREYQKMGKVMSEKEFYEKESNTSVLVSQLT